MNVVNKARVNKSQLAIYILASGLVLGTLVAVSPFVTAGSLTGVLAIIVMLVIVAYRPYWVVLFLTAFMPFEDFFLKFLPGPDQIYFASRFVSEILIYLAFGVLIVKKVLTGGKLRRTPIDGPLLIFGGIAVLSIVANQAPLVGSLVNLHSLLRYVILFYLIVNLDLTPKQIRWLLRVIILVGLVQVLIGGLQLVTKGAVNGLLLPRQMDVEIAGQTRGFVLIARGRELRSIFGTTGDTIFFALFMLVVFGVYLSRLKKLRVRDAPIMIAIFMAANFAYARAVVFGILLMLLMFYRLRYGLNKAFKLLVLMLPVGLLAITLLFTSSFVYRAYRSPLQEEYSIIENLTGVFTLDYVRRAQYQRLGALIGVTPTVIMNRPILGYGPDEITTVERLNASHPSYLRKELTKNGFEDVYWTAILAYYGLAGLGAMIFLLYRLYASGWKIYKTTQNSLTRETAIAIICMVGVALFLLFFYRILEFRAYSYYFWLLAGLVFGLYAQEINSGPIPPQIDEPGQSGMK